jgi:PEP-CTERM motif
MTSISRSMLCAAVSGLAFALATVAASAVTFTSSSAFKAATSGLSVEDYGAYAAGTLIPEGSSLGALTYSFTTAAGLGGVVTNIYNSFSGNSLAAKQSAGPLDRSDVFLSGEEFTVTFPSPVTAVGIFSNTNLPASSVTLDTSAGSAATTFVVYDTLTFGFLGFASSTPFSSATFTQSSPDFNIPEIEYGAFTGTVPEPSTWALTLLGFAGLGYVAYHRQRKQMLFGIV